MVDNWLLRLLSSQPILFGRKTKQKMLTCNALVVTKSDVMEDLHYIIKSVSKPQTFWEISTDTLVTISHSHYSGSTLILYNR